MPLLPFIMYTIAATAVFFMAGIGYMSTDHLIERERIEGLAGEYVAITMGLEAYRAENGAFPTGSDWQSRIEVYSPRGPLPARDEGGWNYAVTAAGYSLCFTPGTGAESPVVNATFICPSPETSPTGSGA